MESADKYKKEVLQIDVISTYDTSFWLDFTLNCKLLFKQIYIFFIF